MSRKDAAKSVPMNSSKIPVRNLKEHVKTVARGNTYDIVAEEGLGFNCF